MRSAPHSSDGSPSEATDFYETNRALLDALSHLHAIADALPVLVSYVGTDHRYRFVNVGYETWFGQKRIDLIGKHLRDVLGADAYERVLPHIEHALAGETVVYEAELPYAHGGARFIEATYIPHRDQNGQVAGFAALVTDVSERKRRERAMAALLRENEQARIRAEQLYRFAEAVVTAENAEQVFEAALDAIERAMGVSRLSILVFDREGVLRFRAWRKLSDAYRAAVEGHSPWSRDAVAPQPVLVPDATREPSLAPFSAALEREGVRGLAFIPLVSSGRLLGKFMVYYEEPHTLTEQELGLATAIANHLASAIVRYRAVTKLEETVRYQELFAGVLAHDLRNPLSAIVTAANLLLMRLEGEGDKVGKPLSRILSSGERMSRMISQLLDFTRARLGGGFELQLAEANLGRLCEVAASEIEVAHPDWKIVRQHTGNLDGVWDSDRMLQVLSNLIANAGQHGEPGSAITLRLDGSRPAEVELVIQNLGVIPAHLLRDLFDPFRRAHNRPNHTHGIGLGLFITREIVEAHGGSVHVESSEASGTVFRVALPRVPARLGNTH